MEIKHKFKFFNSLFTLECKEWPKRPPHVLARGHKIFITFSFKTNIVLTGIRNEFLLFSRQKDVNCQNCSQFLYHKLSNMVRCKKTNFQGLLGDDESLGTAFRIFLCVFTSSLFCCRATSVHRKLIWLAGQLSCRFWLGSV